MCDFLISLGHRYTGKHLLELLKVPYGEHSPEGKYFDFAWGCAAILEERLARNMNIFSHDENVFSWVGDLIIDDPTETVKLLVSRIINIKTNDLLSLEDDDVFKKINGAFALLIAHANGFSIITDPMNFTPVYSGMDINDNIVSFGTHPDLVACISRDKLYVDKVSAAEYLSYGNSVFPGTMHINVKEINPGRLHNVFFENDTIVTKEHIYWKVPEEIRKDYNEDILTQELKHLFVSMVREQCRNKDVAVLLSGGLDSRLIMALVPKNVNCFGLTFSESFNREAKTAKRVAECYKRDWKLLLRDSEFLADSLTGITRLIGCECEWASAHAYGFAEEISKYKVDYLLNGQMLDSFLRAMLAFDYVREKRRFSLFGSAFRKDSTELNINRGFFVDNDPGFWTSKLTNDVIEGVYNRRKEYYESLKVQTRGSTELFFMYPFSHALGCANWIADRKTIPMRLIASDRRLLDFAFRCPIELKLNSKLYLKAAMKVFGPGARISNANDGVRPGSSQLSRLAQRAVRKSRDKMVKIFECFGKEHKVQHSWSDYKKYWIQSRKLKSLIEEYAENLDQFDGRIFKESSRELLRSKEINWRNGFRLLHLAVWAGIIKDYYKCLEKSN
jgi:asparagine synthetase B (glutamine-hydrolysing)